MLRRIFIIIEDVIWEFWDSKIYGYSLALSTNIYYSAFFTDHKILINNIIIFLDSIHLAIDTGIVDTIITDDL